MANRDLVNFRQVTQTVASNSSQIAAQSAEMFTNILRERQEAKVAEGVSQAQVELSALENQYRIDFQGDPTGGMQEYKQSRQEILDRIGSDISPLYRGTWNKNAKNIALRNDATQQSWAMKQTRVNTVEAVNKTMKNDFSQSLSDGMASGS